MAASLDNQISTSPQSLDQLLNSGPLLHTENNDPGAMLAELKAAVTSINVTLKQSYENGLSTCELVTNRALLIDRLLIEIFESCFNDVRQKLSLVAVGGYGRGELHPCSDIDIMLLLENIEDEATTSALEKFITLLWDSKLDIGHSVRTVSECVVEAKKDITVATNIIESRHLCGNETLYEQMLEQTGPDKIWDNRSFFQAKLEEQITRNGKFNDTAYNLEPNIKESRGGLRDIQMVGWVAKRHFNAKTLDELVSHGYLQKEELDALLQGQELLWRIRIHLHYAAGRREDRLLFDLQRQLAADFGYSDGKNNLAIEQFMQNYYRTVVELERLNEMLLQHFREAILYADEPGEPVILDKHFQTRHKYIEVRDEQLFEKHPEALLEIFLVMQQHPEIQGVRAATIRLIRANRHRINDKFRRSRKAKKLFISIMSQPRGITHELRRMNRYGLLAAYIPAFEDIVGRMQYDLFHSYTVDQHSLFVIRNLRRFAVPEHAHEFPLASGIYHHIQHPEILYLAGLFHDIAKGRGGDHSELGAADALRFCLDHGLGKRRSRLVSWLVKNHLVMSLTAQRKDISDQEVTHDFAQRVRTLENLDYLYLLTVADIRGTNPENWNSWKDSLLIELYNRTAEILHMGSAQHLDKQETISKKQTDALRMLDRHGYSPHQVHAFWEDFSPEYFIQHEPNEIHWQTKTILDNHDPELPLVKARHDAERGSIDLFIHAPTRDGLFAIIVGTLNQLSLNIVHASISFRNSGYTVESFKLVDDDTHSSGEEFRIKEIVERVHDSLLKFDHIPGIDTPIPPSHRHFDIKTKVSFEPGNDSETTRINIMTRDYPGLLSKIGMIFVKKGVRIHSARISTEGAKANDFFHITSVNTSQPLDKEERRSLSMLILEELGQG